MKSVFDEQRRVGEEVDAARGRRARPRRVARHASDGGGLPGDRDRRGDAP